MAARFGPELRHLVLAKPPGDVDESQANKVQAAASRSNRTRTHRARHAKMHPAGLDRCQRPPFSGAIGMPGRAAGEEHDAMRMQEIDIHDYARQLLEAHGDKAVAEAAQKARTLEQQGNSEQAETWRHIEAALKLMRGPHES
jgi:hypothetical protein